MTRGSSCNLFTKSSNPKRYISLVLAVAWEGITCTCERFQICDRNARGTLEDNVLLAIQYHACLAPLFVPPSASRIIESCAKAWSAFVAQPCRHPERHRVSLFSPLVGLAEPIPQPPILIRIHVGPRPTRIPGPAVYTACRHVRPYRTTPFSISFQSPLLTPYPPCLPFCPPSLFPRVPSREGA